MGYLVYVYVSVWDCLFFIVSSVKWWWEITRLRNNQMNIFIEYGYPIPKPYTGNKKPNKMLHMITQTSAKNWSIPHKIYFKNHQQPNMFIFSDNFSTQGNCKLILDGYCCKLYLRFYVGWGRIGLAFCSLSNFNLLSSENT